MFHIPHTLPKLLVLTRKTPSVRAIIILGFVLSFSFVTGLLVRVVHVVNFRLFFVFLLRAVDNLPDFLAERSTI